MQARESMRKSIRFAILAVLGAGLVAALLLPPVISCLADALGCVERSGVWGPVVLGVFYVVCCVFLVPGSIPTLTAGFLFGVLAWQPHGDPRQHGGGLCGVPGRTDHGA